MKLLLITFFILTTSITASSADCESWFKALKIKRDKDCLIKCASAGVDMGTFTCPNQCAALCKIDMKTDWMFSLSDLYPGLTAAERALAAKDPKKMLKAYQLSWETEQSCLTLYPQSSHNDESDACRHYIWAGLLYNEFGSEFTKQVLEAHESNPNQPEKERAMDVANNGFGIIEAQILLKKKKLSKQSLIESYQDSLKRNKLIILNKSENKEELP